MEREEGQQDRAYVDFLQPVLGSLGFTLKSLCSEGKIEEVPGGAVISEVSTPEALPSNLRKGLLLVEVMGKNVRGLSFRETCERIRGAGRPLKLRFEPRKLTVLDEHITRNRATRRGMAEGEDAADKDSEQVSEQGGEEGAVGNSAEQA